MPETASGLDLNKLESAARFAKIPADQLDRFERFVANLSLSRQELISQALDPRRDIDDECGYPSDSTSGGIGSAINLDIYRQLYNREAIAARVVQVLPKECWQVQPTVYEDEDTETITDFEEAWDQLGRRLRGEASWYQDEQGSPVWEYLKRVDILSGIGHFGVLLLGIDDGLRLDQPVEGVSTTQRAGSSVNYEGVRGQAGPFGGGGVGAGQAGVDQAGAYGQAPIGTDAQYVGIQLGPPEYPAAGRSKKQRQLLFLRPFDEWLCQIVQYEADVHNPRFGQPKMYRITLNDPREVHSGIGLPLATVNVHWSRVLHVADNLNSSEIFGVPRMRPVLNRLLDLRKLYSGSAEMYWRGAFPGLSLETHPQLGGDVMVDQQGLRDMTEQWMNGLQRYLALSGMSAKMLSPTVSDPSPQIATQIEALCIQLSCPIRVFKGSERGELASNQDDASWNDRLRERQQSYLTPRLIVPFVDRLIQMGVLPEPKGFSVLWPDLDSNTDAGRAAIGLQKTQALAAYVQGGVENLVGPHDYLTRFLGLDEKESSEMLDNTQEAHAKEDTLTTPPMDGGRPKAPEKGQEGYQPPPPKVVQVPGGPPGAGGAHGAKAPGQPSASPAAGGGTAKVAGAPAAAAGQAPAVPKRPQ